MRVVMNGLAALKPKTGVGHYVARLHAAMSDDVALYPGETQSWLVRKFQNGLTTGGTAKPGVFSLRATGSQIAKHLGKTAVGIHFARHCRAIGYELYHEPNFIPFATSMKTVITVHDLSVLRFPQWHPADRVQHHERHFGAALKRASHIIAVSETVRRELIETTSVPAAKVTAILNGVGAEFRPQSEEVNERTRRRLALPSHYFLAVGTIEPRKNILAILRAFVDLPNAIREQCPLVLAGPWGWKSEPEREYLHTYGKNVHHLGYVAADDLPAIYSGATALLYPSHYEGFGLPPAEMLACGGAVFASRSAEAVREVVGPHAEWLDAGDIPGWRDAMLRAVTDREFVAELRQGGIAHARQFSWRRAADATLATYRNVLGIPVQTVPSRRAA